MPDDEREQALVKGIEKYGKFIFWYLNQKSQDHAFVDDVAQIFWKHVFEKFPLQDFDKIGYLKNKAHQIFIDEVRKRKVRDFVSYAEDPYESAHPDDLKKQRDEPEEPQLYEQFWGRFHALNIPETHKQIFWYHHRYGYTMKEIAQMLQIAPSTAHDWLKLVKSQCVDYLNKENDV
ncbi:MAG: RNA polymerase sigma factor (sigma-70 family) [Rubritalea sp.]